MLLQKSHNNRIYLYSATKATDYLFGSTKERN
nr:MAG TPA: hypothetical protein [Caudoviricetes sp.]DAS33538.1 MAG TPA: hypothetical protein [Caudoviricetes sp.]